MTKPFEFKQSIILPKSTGKKASSLSELRDLIASAGPASIFHHTYQYFLKGHILEYTNDFAHWAGESLEESALAEHLSSIDPYDLSGVEEVRREVLAAIDAFREQFPEPRQALLRDEFFFNEAVTLVFPAGLAAQNLAEFLMAVRYVDASALYYHFYDARVRQGGTNDFSFWFAKELGKKDLADRVQAIDPFMHSLEGIRERIGDVLEGEVRKDMESAGVRA